ncbi:MAG: hypothetical protein V3V20_07700, partial [Algisphaera sp.]
TFDAPTVDDRVIVQACERFKQFTMPVYLIPGNHDPDAGPGSGGVYRRQTLVDHCPAHVHVLTDTTPVVVPDHDAIILPAPLRYKSVAGDPTAHLTAAFGRDTAGVTAATLRIGLAHGSVVGFTSDADGAAATTLAPQRAAQAELDYLALGDWHGHKIIDPRTAYPGAPELTGFRDNDAGQALVVTLADHATLPTLTRVPVATTQWIRKNLELTTAAEVNALADWFNAIDRPTHTLVRLELRGALPLAELQRLNALLDAQAHRLLHLRRRGPGIHAQPTDDEIDNLASDGYLRDAVAQLRDAANDPHNTDDARAAADALHLLHRLRTEAQQQAPQQNQATGATA